MERDLFKKLICNRISQLREERNLTIEQLAYQSGISKGGLSEIEKIKKLPSPFTIAKVCSGLGITINQFFDFEEIDIFIDKL